MQIMKDSNNHNTKNMNKLVQNIQGFKKKQESVSQVDLQSVLQKYMKQIMQEMEARLVKYIDEVVVPSNQPHQNTSNNDMSRSVLSNAPDYGNTSQLLNHTQNTTQPNTSQQQKNKFDHY